MRIMIHSNSPTVPTGYGTQVRLLGREMTRAGHQVAVSAFNGFSGGIIEWEGMTILPGGQLGFGVDTIIPHAVHYAADLVITLMDFWQLSAIAEHLTELNLATWIPIDCAPMGWMDRGAVAQSGAQPLAMSRFGLAMLHQAGFEDAVYLPHTVDTEVFAPLPADKRAQFRAGMGIGDRFVIGMVAANSDHLRKGWQEQFEAFRRFHAKHSDSILVAHTVAGDRRGLDLRRMATQMGLEDGSYHFSDTYPQLAGIFDGEMMSDLYNVMDVLSCCSYAEGFGVPMLEAQACGTPVISTRGSAMDEMRGRGWSVTSQPFWNYTHGAWWQRPDISSIARAYEKAYLRSRGPQAGMFRDAAREFALDYDSRKVFKELWVPYLDSKIAEIAEKAGAA